jgi:type II secretory pathway predicted ATPase ExeA
MFLEYYQLREQPFGVTPDPRFLYFGPSHSEALASLIYSIESRRGFSAMVAEPGMGKTTLLFRLLETLRGTARTAFLFQLEGDPRDLLRSVLADLGITAQSQDLGSLHEALNTALLEEMRAGRQVVVVLDEAQNLDERSLESVRLLSNFETATQKLIHIVLAGQPKLGERLAGADLKQLRQRVSTIIRIDPFTPEETEAYVEWRLRVAGHQGPPIFTPDAIDMISRVSKGIPRNINSLCFQALSTGFAADSKMIDAEIMREVVADLDPNPRQTYRPRASNAAVASARPVAPAPPAVSAAEPASVAATASVARPRPVPAAVRPKPEPKAIPTTAIFESWAIAPPAREGMSFAKKFAIAACVIVPVMLIVGFSLPRLGLGDTAAGKISGRAINAILSSTGPGSDSTPQAANNVQAPAAPSADATTETPTASQSQIPALPAPSAVAGSDPSVGNMPVETASTPVAAREPVPAPAASRKIPDTGEASAEALPAGDRKAPVAAKNSVVQVTHRENLFEFALENYGKSSREIVDDIRQLNPQLTGPYDMLKAGERIQLPDESSTATQPEKDR